MQLHLDQIVKDIEPGRHAVLMLDKAGWHTSPKLDVPGNLTLLPLPAKCPELNPVENVWEFMRDNWLSNRIFLNYDDIVDHCCDAWNKLRNQPWRVMSIGLRDWAHRS
jgi:transposase